MDFLIAKEDLNTALRQILQGRKKDSGETIDITAGGSEVEFVITGRSAAYPAEAQAQGSASIPIGIATQMKRTIGTYPDEKLRIRISEGKLRLQNTAISNPLISMKRIAGRIIDLPINAAPLDFLCLPLIFSVDEIEDCGLHGKVLDAQTQLSDAVTSAYLSLQAYGLDREELKGIVRYKIQAHADGIRKVLFTTE